MACQDAWETLHPGRRRAHLLAVQPAGTGQEVSLEPGRRIADRSLTLNEPVGASGLPTTSALSGQVGPQARAGPGRRAVAAGDVERHRDPVPTEIRSTRRRSPRRCPCSRGRAPCPRPAAPGPHTGAGPIRRCSPWNPDHRIQRPLDAGIGHVLHSHLERPLVDHCLNEDPPLPRIGAGAGRNEGPPTRRHRAYPRGADVSGAPHWLTGAAGGSASSADG